MENSLSANRRFFSGVVLLLIAVLYTFLSHFTPFAYDDWIFMAEWREVNGNKPFGFATLYEFWKDVRLYDNARISNVFSPLSTMFPPWNGIFPVVTGLLVAVIVYLATCFAFSKRKVSALYLSAVWLALLLFLPWRNSLFVPAYSLNYIWAAAITMAFMVAVVRFERTGWNLPNFILVLVIAFFAGGWHEGFSIATLCGFLIYTAVKRFKFSPQWYFAGLFYAAVALAFLLSPGVLGRSQRQFGVANIGQSYFKMFFDFLPVIFLIFVIFLTGAVPALRKYLKEALGNVWFVIGAGIVIAGTLLSLLFTHQARSAFWPDLMAVVMLFIISKPVWSYCEKSVFRNYITWLALAAAVVPMIFTLIWQYRLYRESELLINKIEVSKSGTVYHDIIQGSEIPIVTLKMTNYPAWVTDFHFHALKEYTGKPFPAVLPKAMESFSSTSPYTPLQGNAGAIKTNSAIVIPENIFGKPITAAIDITLASGEEIPATALLLPFFSSDNKEMTYIVVYGFSVDDIEGLSI